MKRYNHIPKHLRPVRIPKIRVQNQTGFPNFLKRHLISMISLILFPLIGLDSEDADSAGEAD
jgi:hypothetical protein